MNTVLFSAIAVIISIILFFILCMRGFGAIPAALLCTVVIGLTAESGLATSVFSTFVTGTMGFASNMLLAFLSGGMLAGLMNATGSSEVIGDYLAKKLGARFIPYILMIITFLLAYVGVMSYVFIVAYLGFGLLKAVDLPRTVGIVAMGGTGCIGMMLAPGSASVPNLIPTMSLGTDLYAGSLIGWIMVIIGLGLNVIYIECLIRTYRKNNIGYTDPPQDALTTMTCVDKKPSLGAAFSPILLVIALCVILLKVLHLDSNMTVVIAQVAGTILLYALNWKHLPADKLTLLSKGIIPTLTPLMCTSCVVGYATVVNDTAIYATAVQFLANMDVNPYVMVVISVGVLCLLCADGMGGISSFLAVLAPQVLATGADPAIVHRLGCAAATTFDSLPHNGSINMNLMVFGLTHKEAYKNLVVVQIGIPVIYTVVGLILAIILY